MEQKLIEALKTLKDLDETYIVDPEYTLRMGQDLLFSYFIDDEEGLDIVIGSIKKENGITT